MLASYRQDREALPLWTYQPDAWEPYGVPWFVQASWSPRVRARPLVGQSSGYWRYLENTQIDGRQVKWIEAFGAWPDVTVKLGRREGEITGEATVAMPRLLQVHVAGLYAATGNRLPDEMQEIALPEQPDAPDVKAFLADARNALDRLYEELEAVVTGDPELLERLRQDFGRRIAQDKWWKREVLEVARDEIDQEKPSPDAEYHLRKELEQREMVTELLERMEAFPSLRGDRKIPVTGDLLLQLDQEAQTLVDRYRSWEPEAEQILLLIKLVREDPTWRINDSAEHRLALWRERLETGSRDRPTGELVRAIESYARWLRFPYLPSPRPDFLSGTRKQAARALLATTLPGDVNVRTLENYLSRARTGGK